MKMTVRTSKVVQVSNIAPQVTKDQMHVLFGFLGKIEDIRLYPTVRDLAYAVHSRICYIKFEDASTVPVAQHMTNTVFIDRALIVIPMSNNDIPDECYVLEMTNHGTIVPGLPIKDPKLPPHVVNSVYGSGKDQVIHTTDTNLDSNGLPPYPPLPANYDTNKVEESRRTILMLNYNPAVTTDEVIDFFTSAGEVKFLRMCKRNSDESINMLVEFTDQPSVVNALKMNGMDFKGRPVEIQHATQAILKTTQTKSDEVALQEIVEAASRFEEEQFLLDATNEPAAKTVTKNERRSRSRSSGRRKRSRSSSRSRGKSRSRRRKSTSRNHRSSSRRRGRSGSKSRSRRSRSRRRGSTSRSHRSSSRRRDRKGKERSYRIQSRDRDRDRSKDRKSRKRVPSKEKERGKDENGSSCKGKEDDKCSEAIISEKRSRSRSRDRKRSRSGDGRRRSTSPQISRQRKNKSRSRDRDRKKEKKSDQRDKGGKRNG